VSEKLTCFEEKTQKPFESDLIFVKIEKLNIFVKYCHLLGK